MTVTAVADRVLTVIRGANGTVASSHGLGETVTVVTDNSLTASVSASDTAITVNDLLLFPPDPSVSGNLNFDIEIGHERLTVTAITGNTLTVRLGVGGTVAAAHTAGEIVDPIVFAAARA